MLLFCLLLHREKTGLNKLGQVWGRNIEQVTPEWWLSKEISVMRTQKSVKLLSKLLDTKAVTKPQVCIRARLPQRDLGSKSCTRHESKAKEKSAKWPLPSTPPPEAASLAGEPIFTSDSKQGRDAHLEVPLPA